MVIKSTIKKKNERGRWNFLVNAAQRAPEGTAIVIEGLDKMTRHSADESIRRRTKENLVALDWRGLVIVYKPSKDFWERVDEE